jgi:hypothetical protein
MKINQDNYEQYFLDHAEGNLSPEMERELEEFLEANPDLKAILEDFSISPILTDNIHSESLKLRLKKNILATDHINEQIADEWMVRQMEGLLDETEEKELAEFIRLNPAYAYDQEKYRQAKLVPDPSITYSKKQLLKKKAAVLPLLRRTWLVTAAAAVILLFFGIRYSQGPVVPPGTPSQLAGTPSHSTETPSQPTGTPSQPTGTPSRSAETPSHSTETPSQYTGTPSHPTPLRLKPATADNFEIALTTAMPELNITAYNISPVQFTAEKKKSLIGKVFNNMLAQAKEGLSRKAEFENLDNPDFSLWSLAKAGINGYNSIADRDLELFVHRDEEGKVTSYALIEQDHLLLEKSLGKN